jgi:hypothetical protein
MNSSRTIAASVLALSAAGLGMTTAANPAIAASTGKPRMHYVGTCRASGQYPICSVDSSNEIRDPAKITIYVWGSIRLPGGHGRIEADTFSICDKGSASSQESDTYKWRPPYFRPLRRAYYYASECEVNVQVEPANDQGSGTVHAEIYYTKRNGR